MASSSPRKPWSETRNSRIAALVSVVGLFVMVFWIAMKSGKLLAEPAPLVVSEEYLNFGEVWEDKNFHWKIPIMNRTNENIKIVNFARSCNCLSIEPSSLIVPTNSAAEVLLILDLTKGRASNRLHTREFDVMITPLVSGKVKGKGWKIKGRVRGGFAFDSSIVQFEPYYFAGHAIAPKMVNLTFQDGLTDLSVACEPDVAQVRLHSVAGKRDCVEVEVSPNKSLPPGVWRGQLVAQARTSDAKILTSDRLPVSIEVLDEVQIVPQTLFLGIVAEGIREERTLTIQSLSGDAFSVEGVQKGRTDIEITPIPRASAEQLKLFRISHRVQDLGSQQCMLTFSIRTKKGRIVKLPIVVTWHGIERER